MRDPGHPRHFTDEFKRQIVDLYNAGKPKREIMAEYDLGKSTVERWVKSINATGSSRAADSRTESTPIPFTLPHAATAAPFRFLASNSSGLR